MNSEAEIIEEELVYGARRRELMWQKLGLTGMAFGMAGCLVAALVALLDVDPPPMIVPFDSETGTAAAGLRALWTSGHEAYPPDSYGTDARLEVEVLSITHISANRAQVRLRKRLNSPRGTQNGLFTATLMFEFRPENSRSIDDVWQNPFGFTVTEYAIRSDRLE